MRYPDRLQGLRAAGNGHLTCMSSHSADSGFLPSQPERRALESIVVRLVATAGIIGIGTAIGAVLVANDVAGWVASLVVSTLSVVLAGVLWRSRQL
jgi:ribose 5-phosphate isomerase RpiB